MMKKNRGIFFMVATISVAAVCVFSSARANAYTVSSTPGQMYDYSFTSSVQSLFSPFEGFFQNLRVTNGTPININITRTTLPSLNIAAGLENIFRQWLNQVNHWFYGLTGVQLSGIIFVLLTIISWVLNVAQNIVNWLLGLFH